MSEIQGVAPLSRRAVATSAALSGLAEFAVAWQLSRVGSQATKGGLPASRWAEFLSVRAMSLAAAVPVDGSTRRPAQGRQEISAASTGSARQSRRAASGRRWVKCMAPSITAAFRPEILLRSLRCASENQLESCYSYGILWPACRLPHGRSLAVGSQRVLHGRPRHPPQPAREAGLLHRWRGRGLYLERSWRVLRPIPAPPR